MGITLCRCIDLFAKFDLLRYELAKHTVKWQYIGKYQMELPYLHQNSDFFQS